MKVQLISGGLTETFVVHRKGKSIRVTPEGGGYPIELDVVAWGDGEVVLALGPRRLIALGAAQGASRQLSLNGRILTYARELGGTAREAARDSGMAATIPAVVLEILVSPGDSVVEGQKLLLLESMKMVIPILSSRPGVVRAMLCREGEAVQPGIPLVEIDDAVPNEATQA